MKDADANQPALPPAMLRLIDVLAEKAVADHLKVESDLALIRGECQAVEPHGKRYTAVTASLGRVKRPNPCK